MLDLSNSDRLSDAELETVKHQLSALVPKLARFQLYELGDLLYDAARKRRDARFDENRHYDVQI